MNHAVCGCPEASDPQIQRDERGRCILKLYKQECRAYAFYRVKRYDVEGKKYFKYYDEVNVTIDGIDYKGIILDSCGACMKVTYEERLDLFVNSGENAIDRGYKGNNPIYVNW